MYLVKRTEEVMELAEEARLGNVLVTCELSWVCALQLAESQILHLQPGTKYQ